MEWNDKVALVTGAGSGIGRATAIAFAERGAKVVVAGLKDSGLGKTKEAVEEVGGDAHVVHSDVSHQDGVERMVREAVETFGRLDFAVNNAGIEGNPAPIVDHAVKDFDRVVAVNLRGVFLGLKYEIPEVKKTKGAIVNVSSIAGVIGFPTIAPYVATKHGVIGLTKTAALENAKEGIRVNAVCPAGVRTPMLERFTGGDQEAMAAGHPLGRVAEPEEVAEAILWLCSDEASYINGHALMVDGAYTVQ